MVNNSQLSIPKSVYYQSILSNKRVLDAQLAACLCQTPQPNHTSTYFPSLPKQRWHSTNEHPAEAFESLAESLPQVKFSVKNCIKSHEQEPVWIVHKNSDIVKIAIHFHGHYGEPPITIDFDSEEGQRKYIEYQLKYDPLTGAWSITKNKTCIDQLADLLKETQLS